MKQSIMIPASGVALEQFSTTRETSFVRTVCLPILENSQNEDGGWGFRAGLASRVEPTCWALLALLQSEFHEEQNECISRGLDFLRRAQLADGSWPASPEQQTGASATSLACWTLLAAKDASNAAAAGLRWICSDWPRDSALWRRIVNSLLRRNKKIVQHNDAYRGWGWTPRTASWVEPTAFALIALSQCPAELRPTGAKRRERLGKGLLLDRVCPGGGWNCGNPKAYGVAGEPLVVPTAWALIALREERDLPEVKLSLEWLRSNASDIHSGPSLALARLCLETFGVRTDFAEKEIRNAFERNAFLENICAAAWACLAFLENRRWLNGVHSENC